MNPAAYGTPIGPRAALLQCACLVALACLISAVFGPRPLWALVADSGSVPWQFAAGAVSGCAFAAAALIATLRFKPFARFRTHVLALSNRLDFGGWNPVWLGLCAGVGEELLFRGALQPLLGVWWSALLFALVHYGIGGFKSMNLMKWGYAAFLFLTSLMLAWVRIQVGLIAAVTFHAVGDAIVFLALREVAERQVSPVEGIQ
jgi:hypothetical protein